MATTGNKGPLQTVISAICLAHDTSFKATQASWSLYTKPSQLSIMEGYKYQVRSSLHQSATGKEDFGW